MKELDAIVLAMDARSRVRIAGLTARERAIRVCRRVGATRVVVVDDAAQLAELDGWAGTRPLVVVQIGRAHV